MDYIPNWQRDSQSRKLFSLVAAFFQEAQKAQTIGKLEQCFNYKVPVEYRELVATQLLRDRVKNSESLILVEGTEVWTYLGIDIVSQSLTEDTYLLIESAAEEGVFGQQYNRVSARDFCKLFEVPIEMVS